MKPKYVVYEIRDNEALDIIDFPLGGDILHFVASFEIEIEAKRYIDIKLRIGPKNCLYTILPVYSTFNIK